MARFLHEHGAKAANVCIREAFLEYILAVTEVGVPNEFNDTLWDFEELMQFFDIAENVVTSSE
ncbi:hypothetical protein [Arachidicoccus soli]|uniref:Uncharacterized protein n=1 Tax=Arachidicoccus soli TaxID=2341117 RepID=A0A386HL88_9BACT|nr:hypothetical protein [Arachidicoccus soli]AYD46389.1 hypothetical protein D6B99_01400 [Arachidicoccus soli]